MSELAILQGIRLKGRVSVDDLAATIGADAYALTPALNSLLDAGLLIMGKTVRLTPAGRERLDELLAEERSGIDQPAMVAVYDEFRTVNSEFKVLVSDWQLKDGAPNTHDDPDYDAAVLARLDRLHAAVLPIVTAAAVELPRLAHYADKLCAALDKVRSGDTAWLTRPIVDSYHTVWFELHEEMIVAAGLTREQEAAAGHA